MTKTEKPSKTHKPAGSARSLHVLPWSPLLTVAIVFIVYFAASILGELASFVYPVTQGWSIDEGLAWLRESTIGRSVQVAAFYGSMLWLLHLFIKKKGITFRDLGLVSPRLRDIGYALLAVVPYIAGYAILLATALALVPSLNADQEQQLGFEPGRDVLALVLTFFCLVILPPIAEEITMRGFLFTSLRGRMKFVWATVSTSVLFAIAHLQFDSDAPLLWVAAIDTFVLSIVLCFLREKTGSLWAGIVLHGLKNCVAFLSLFVFHLS